jgi:uracil-DNA glycosylase family 4
VSKDKCYSCSFGSQCRSNKLEGRGKKTAPIMIVTEAPDWQDDNKGKILQGDGGKKLFYLLEKAGIPRSQVYVTNAIKCKPAVKPAEIKDKRDKVDKKTKEVTEAGDKPISMCRVHLLKEIKENKPKVIVLMGRVPHLMMTGNTSVTEYRGHFTEMSMNYKTGVEGATVVKELTIPMLPSFSPTASLTKWEYDDYIIHDLKKAYNYTKTKRIPLTPDPKFTVIDNIKKLRAWKKIMLKAKGKPCIHDFETTSLDFKKGEIINSGYSLKKDHAYIIYPLKEWPEDHQKKFTPEQKERVKVLTRFAKKHAREIHKTLKTIHSSGIYWVGHNHKFDRKYALEAGYPFTHCMWDTIVMDSTIDENKMHSLNIVMEYNGINYGPYDTFLYPYVNKDPKNKKPYTNIPPDLLDQYLAKDTAGCRRLFFNHLKVLKTLGRIDFYKKQQRPLLDELTLMEFHGFNMNIELMKSDAEKVGLIMEENIKKLRKLVGDPEFNPNSTQQLSAHMERLGFPFERLKIKQGKQGYSTDADSMMKFLRYKKWKKIPELILLNRALGKLKNTYIINTDGTKGMLPKIDENGYLHCNFNAHTPRTGRLSSDTPNFQNIPNPSHGINIRNYFIPPEEGWVTWEADYSALEMKVVAHLSQDPVMLQELKDGTDMHSKNAVTFGHVLGFVDKSVDYDWFKIVAKYDPEKEKDYLKKYGAKKLAEIKKLHPEFSKLRAFAKSVGFGLNYGIEARTLSEDHNVPLEDVEVAIDTYFKRYKKLAKWREKQGNLAIKRGYLELPWTGRRRQFTQFYEWINSKYAQDIRKREFDISAIKRQAMNFPVQGFANEIFTRGKLKVIKRLRAEGLKSTIRITIHDGVVGVGPVEEMSRVKQICHEEMTTFLGKENRRLELNVDFNVNEYWYGSAVTNYEELAVA